jgi:hypothetical protein
MVTYSPDGYAKSEEEYKKIDDGIVGLINEARKAMKIDGEIDKSQVKFINFPVTADSKFYFTFTGPMCGKGKCVARGTDFEKPTENVLVLGSKKQKLYVQGTRGSINSLSNCKLTKLSFHSPGRVQTGLQSHIHMESRKASLVTEWFRSFRTIESR